MRYSFARHLTVGSLYIGAVALLAFFIGAVENPRPAYAALFVVAGLVALVLSRFRVLLVDAAVAAVLIAIFVSMGLWEDQRVRRLRKIPSVAMSEVAKYPDDVILELRDGVVRNELTGSVTRATKSPEGSVGYQATPVVGPEWSPTQPIEVWSANPRTGASKPEQVGATRYAFPVSRSEREGALEAAKSAADRFGLSLAENPRAVKLVADPRRELGQRLMVHFYLPVGIFMVWAAGVLVAAMIAAQRRRGGAGGP